MVEVERTRIYEVAPQDMWARIGDFHGLHTWHPGIADSRPSEDGKVRTLTLADDAGSFVEIKTSEEELQYSYGIDEGSLPVRDYEATLLVREAGDGGSEVVWSARFEIEGTNDEEAAKIAAGKFFDAGLDSLETPA